MPVSYIQITQNDTLPASSDTSKAIIGVNTSNQITVTDSSGITTPLTGSSPAYTASYLVYSALFNSGLTYTVLKNTLGFEPAWENPDPGVYAFNFSGSVDLTKVVVSISPNSTDNLYSIFDLGTGGYDVILIVRNTANETGTLTQTPIEIRQYL